MGVTTRTSTSNRVVLFMLLTTLTYPGWWRRNVINFHPIDMLIYEAKIQHDQYRTDMKRSHSLEEAVAQYQQRYLRNPPPGFDIWYQYAINRSSLIIDNYDQIYNDLLPLWTLSPRDLRVSTWEMTSHPWNEISGITIRQGVATVQENVLPTHRWMLEGVATSMNSFAQYLPDMDLAFNLNDESRIAVPYEDIKRNREKGRRSGNPNGAKNWSDNRSDGWLPSEQDFPETVFHDMSFRNTFAAYGSIGCPPSSAARSNPHVSSQSHICASCIAPHSLGQFISNWSLAADVCHQPDLAHLHGFYLTPAAFKASYLLRPVFSQAKPHGYNDILYPSAWNYMNKTVYHPTEPKGNPGQEDYNPGHPDPDFSAKRNTLFWRGATSEGVSSGDHSWRGMTRQRFVHMANNLTSSAHDTITILLSDSKPHSGKLTYEVIPGTKINDLGLSTDIAIVDHIARCGGIGLHDCIDQEAEFGLVAPTEFQDHWQYRYLFDLDGAGFSGRFLPFLHSKSLPFKTALFREWYDDRLTAWWHFVPQDLRLHGVWSTLAYFAGVNGKVNGKEFYMGAHLKEGEMIAKEGRKWAAQVLRKEDMEIYFFRLLLEWGRLTDDNRDDLGFVP
jgi:Glycosyl transferase family 90